MIYKESIFCFILIESLLLFVATLYIYKRRVGKINNFVYKSKFKPVIQSILCKMHN